MSEVVTVCPACGGELRRLTPRDFNNPYLNEDQAESQYDERAGDWYCKADGCTGPKRGKSGFTYCWDSEVFPQPAPDPAPTPARSEAAGGEEVHNVYALIDRVRFAPDARSFEAARSALIGAIARQTASLRQQLAAAREDAERVAAVRTHIAERTDGDCDGDNRQWDDGFKAACSQILAVLDAARASAGRETEGGRDG